MSELCFKCGKAIKNDCERISFDIFCETCYEELINSYKGIRVYRFVSPDVLFSMIDKKELIFSLPSKWEDSFEDIYFKLFLDARKTHLLDPIFIREMLATRDSYYCQCWTLTQESQFFWNTYGYNGNAVRIEIDLGDAFEIGFRIEPVRYSSIPSKKEWIMNAEKDLGVKFVEANNPDIFKVDEDGCYSGDLSKKSAEMQYADYVLSHMFDIHEPTYRFEKIPIPKFIATKQPAFMIENEVRLFIKAYSLVDNPNSIYNIEHRNYMNRVYSNYNIKEETLDTHMPQIKPFSYDSNNKFIKSILCHPKMSEDVFELVYNKIKENNLIEIFKGRSKIFD